MSRNNNAVIHTRDGSVFLRAEPEKTPAAGRAPVPIQANKYPQFFGLRRLPGPGKNLIKIACWPLGPVLVSHPWDKPIGGEKSYQQPDMGVDNFLFSAIASSITYSV